MKIIALHSQQVGPLTIVQAVLQNGEPLNFLTSRGAMQAQLVEVSEVSEGGSVNNLRVKNHSDRPVFFSDGDILQGAKQNRVLNVSILLAPKAETVVPVSCVEAGRWRHVSKTFSSSVHLASSQLRAVKAQAVHARMAESSQPDYQSDQQAVWAKVASDHQKLGTRSSTQSLSEAYDQKLPELDAEAVALKPHAGANAVAVVVGGQLLSLDLFPRPDVLEEYLPGIVRGALVDAYGAESAAPPAEEIHRLVSAAIEEVLTRTASATPSVGLGQETRFTAKGYTGFRLEYEGKLVHGTALATAKS
jgi:hypothetical protein